MDVCLWRMQMQSNAICWNPMEAFNFTVVRCFLFISVQAYGSELNFGRAFACAQANEDHNLYTFDMRKLEQALCIHQDHVYAV